MANKILTAKVKFDTKSAENNLTRLAKKINAVQKAIDRTSKNNKALDNAIKRATTSANKLSTATNKINDANLKAVNSAKQIRKGYDSASKSANGLLGTIKKIAGVYFGIEGLKAVMNTSDTLTSAKNRFNNLEGGNPELTAATMDKIYSAAQRSRSGYGDMLSNVSKTMTLAGDSFKGNVDNAIRFQEIMAKAYAVGGASSTEASTSMYQLVQALGSGVLQGDELRSVREGAPLAYKAIEKYAQKVLAAAEAERELEEGALGSTKSLKQLAADGVITSDMVVSALMDADFSGKLEEQFNNTSKTFGQFATIIRDKVIKAFQPALEKINELLNSGKIEDAIGRLEKSFIILGTILYWMICLFDKFSDVSTNAINVCADNWSWLSRVILTVLTIVGAIMAVILFPKLIAWIKFLAWAVYYYAWIGIQAVAAAIKAALAWMTANSVLASTIIVIVAIIILLIWLSNGFADACGMIVGLIMGAISVIWNLFVMLVSLIIKCTIIPLVAAWDIFANFFGNLFNDPISAIIKGFGTLADTVLSILKTIAIGMDAIFGSNLADKIQGWRDDLSTKVDEAVNKWGNGTYEEKSNLSGQLTEIMDNVQGKISWDTSDAYNTGYDWGYTGGEWLSNKFEELVNLLTGKGVTDVNDPNNDVSNGWTQPDIDELLTNVGGMKDSMDIADDDLEWMRKIAEMEWRNEFTTAEIKVEMNNNNTVYNDRDLDGIVEYLSDTLRSEMTSVAYGVHY